MKVVVCLRRGLDGELGAFDASAYEAALQIPDAEVILLSMGPAQTEDYLRHLTRLGATKGVLLCDPAFAGSDTLATAYILSAAIRKLSADLILCGRQTLVGDTGQVGPMLSAFLELPIITQATKLQVENNVLTCATLEQGEQQETLPALVTVERNFLLRKPSIRSQMGQTEVWSREDIGLSPEKCGLIGSPTRVLKTFENTAGRRKCRFISPEELPNVLEKALKEEREKIVATENKAKLQKLCIVGEGPRRLAQTISDDITVLPLTDENTLIKQIKDLAPNAVLWGSDPKSKALAGRISACLGLGLCADCTSLEADGDDLVMYRPALSGSVLAKIVSLTKPAMATVRTAKTGESIVVTAGWGAKDSLDTVRHFAEKLDARLGVSRKMVDMGLMPYELQVGLTGRKVCPKVYIAIGVSGAVHHIAGMDKSGTVIAINPDKSAPIFDYADYGILETVEKFFSKTK